MSVNEYDPCNPSADPLAPTAFLIVRTVNGAGVQHLQRVLKIGFNRASRLYELATKQDANNDQP